MSSVRGGGIIALVRRERALVPVDPFDINLTPFILLPMTIVLPMVLLSLNGEELNPWNTNIAAARCHVARCTYNLVLGVPCTFAFVKF